MSTAQKPEALRLADKFEVDGFLSDHKFAQNQWCSQAAVELRRLHNENLELRAQNDFFEAIKLMLDARTGLDTALKKYGANQAACDGGKCGIGGYCADCSKRQKSDSTQSDALCSPNSVRQPLGDEQISKLWSAAYDDTTGRTLIQVLARSIERAHGIGCEV